MGWSGIEAIPMWPGESRKDAVDRVYADGYMIMIGDDGPHLEPIGDSTGLASAGLVTRAERRWMTDAIGLLESSSSGWRTSSALHESGRRWPWAIDLEHDTAPMFVELMRDAVTLRHIKRDMASDDEWRFWWRILRRFADYPCAIFHPDESELVATSRGVGPARDRYGWF